MRWQHRHLLAALFRRQVAERYQGSVVGLAWALAHPVALLAVYGIVFTSIFRVTLPPEAGAASYLAFVAVGLWPWLMFSEAIDKAMGAIEANQALIRKVSFPIELVVAAAVLACFAVHAVGFVIVLLTLAITGQPLLLHALPWVAVLLAALALAALGVGAVLAVLQTFLPDTRQVVGVALTLVFFATPVLYPRLLVPEALRPWIDANPIGWLLERLRGLLIMGSGPAWSDLLLLVGAFAVFAVGILAFRRLSPYLEDFL